MLYSIDGINLNKEQLKVDYSDVTFRIQNVSVLKIKFINRKLHIGEWRQRICKISIG